MSDFSKLPGQGPTTTPPESLVTPDNATIFGDGTVKSPLTTSAGLYTTSPTPPNVALNLGFGGSDVTAGTNLLPGNVLYVDGTSEMQLGQSDTLAHASVLGFAPDAIANGEAAGYFRSGPLKLTAAEWAAVTTEALGSGLVPGDTYYVSATAGKITHTAPGGGAWDTRVGVALTANVLDVNIGTPVATS